MLKVLIANEDIVAADRLQQALIGNGFEVCGIAHTLEEGLELTRLQTPDLAVMDLRLPTRDLAASIVTRFRHRLKHGILCAANAEGRIDDGTRIATLCQPEDVVRALKIVEQMVNTGHRSAPLPAGFVVLPGVPENDIPPQREDDDASDRRRLQRHQAAMAAFASFALRASDLDTILAEAARACAEALLVPFCRILRYRPDRNDLLTAAATGSQDAGFAILTMPVDLRSPSGRALLGGQPVMCMEADTGLARADCNAEPAVVSTVDVPIGQQDNPFGVLEIGSLQPHDHDQHDIDFLIGFASILAAAVAAANRLTALRNAERPEDAHAERNRLIEAEDRLTTENARLREEKRVLIAELQHRVRNNLQLVYGMICRQLEATQTPSETNGLQAIGTRVITLAKVYDHLLRAGLARTVDFGAYLTGLCAMIAERRTGRDSAVTLTCRSTPMLLDLDCVTALGLVTLELVSNSYAHAYPSGIGTVTVSLQSNALGDEGMILFADQGVGFTENTNRRLQGLRLVRRLVQQIGGTAALRSDNGTEWTVRFPLPAPTIAAN